MYDQKTKTITSRALKKTSSLYVSDQGDLTDLETTVWRGSRTARRWVKVSLTARKPRFTLITKADSVRLDRDDVLITTGTRTDRISGEKADEPYQTMRRPSGPSVTIDGWRSQNREAVRALDVARLRDGTMPLLEGVRIIRHNSTTVQAYATDRFKLTSAVLETTSKPVKFDAIVSGRIVRELARSSAWHLTVWGEQSVAEFCDTGVRVQRMNYDGKYPLVGRLFSEGEPESLVRLEVDPVAFSRSLSRLHAPFPYPAGLSSEGLVAADGSGTFRPDGVVGVEVRGDPQRWVGFRAEYLAGLLRSVAGLGRVRVEWSPDWKTVRVVASDRVRMLLAPARVADGGSVFPVDDEIEV